MTVNWIRSRFNVISNTDDGDMILYNSYTGAIAVVPEEEKTLVQSALSGQGVSGELTGTLQGLQEAGFLVPDTVNEFTRAKYLHTLLHRTDIFHLVMMPTEACNFRCTYCYQTFPHGRMDRETIDRTKKFAEEKTKYLKSFAVSWFGGEPLLAPDIIEELSQSFMASCERNGVTYSADISTNGYYLTPELFSQLIDWQITRFMITIDGPEAMHDSRRGLAGGGPTYARIIENLVKIKQLDCDFTIHLRVNFDQSNGPAVPELIEELGSLFAGDDRFQLFLRPVGRWGGLNDEKLPVYEQREMETKIWDFMELGIDKGLKMASAIEDCLLPGSSICYAAKAHSLAIGSNGQLYKCTCALDEEINHVGELLPDGSVNIDYDKFAQWVTTGDDQDPMCGSCYFRPSCQGNHCPLFRMKTGERPCSFEKRKLKKVLNLICKEKMLQGGE